MMKRYLLTAISVLLILACFANGIAVAQEPDTVEPAECENCLPEENNIAASEEEVEEPDGLPADAVGDDPECNPQEDLELICSYEEDGQPGTFWANGMEDYNAGLLTVNYRLDNTGTSPLLNVRVTEATATNGVTLATELPLVLGLIDPGSHVTFLLQWQLPNQNVTGFQTDIEVCADCPTVDPTPPQPPEKEPEPPLLEQPPEVVRAVLPDTGYSLLAAAVLATAVGAALACTAGRTRNDQR